jgi:hypothetical protein
VNLLEKLLLGTNLALQVLQERLILFTALLLTAGGFAWSMYIQTQLAAAIACAFAILVFLPILWSTGASHAAKHPAPTAESLSTEAPPRQSRGRADRDNLAQRDFVREAAGGP